ncbi:MAG: hypothetical protein DCF32_08500 [Leptolyngbya sp.]|nr:MAG: hypothetical protein DCF32_08500 [Leptolyngbya sp.]
MRHPCQLRTATATWQGYSLDMSEGGAALSLQPAPGNPALPSPGRAWGRALD